MKPWLLRYRSVLLIAVGIALVAGAVVTERARTTGDADPDAVAGTLGPTPGPDAEGYVAEKTTHLARAAEREPERPAGALISFARMLSVSDVRELTSGMRRDVVFAVFPGETPEAVAIEGSLESTIADRVAELRERLQAGGREPLDALAPDCACIYALVVTAVPLAHLAGLQERTDVRLIDVADPPVGDLRGWELTPLHPGEA